MARIRTIKPSFFKNEDLAELPVAARLLFIGLWCLADKEGRLEDRPKRIKAELFPYENLEVDQQLSRLQSAGFISRYTASGGSSTESGFGEMKVIQIINFSKHQRITGSEATSESELPAIGGNTEETTRKHFGNTEDDRKGKDYGKGLLGKGEEIPRAPDLSNSNLFRKPKIPEEGEVRRVFLQQGGTEEMAKKFFEVNEATGWFYKGSPITNFASQVPGYIRTWNENNQKNGSSKNGNHHNHGQSAGAIKLIHQAKSEWDRLNSI